MATLIIKPRSRIFHGHEWVYAMEVQKTIGRIRSPAAVVALIDQKNKPLGTGHLQPQEPDCAHAGFQRKPELDQEFFTRRIRRAFEYRERLFAGQGTAGVSPHGLSRERRIAGIDYRPVRRALRGPDADPGDGSARDLIAAALATSAHREHRRAQRRADPRGRGHGTADWGAFTARCRRPTH